MGRMIDRRGLKEGREGFVGLFLKYKKGMII